MYVTSKKKLSNVVLHFEDGTHQKFDDLSGGYTGNFAGTGENAGKVVIGVWIKSGVGSWGSKVSATPRFPPFPHSHLPSDT